MVKLDLRLLQKHFSQNFQIKSIYWDLKSRFLSTRPLVELVKSIAKLGAIGIFSYFILEDMVLNSIGLVNFTVS